MKKGWCHFEQFDMYPDWVHFEVRMSSDLLREELVVLPAKQFPFLVLETPNETDWEFDCCGAPESLCFPGFLRGTL